MNGKWKVAGAAVAAAATVGIGVALAEEGAEQPQKPRVPSPERTAEMFKAMDTDANGAVSLEEFKAAHEKRIAERKAQLGDKWDEARAAKMPPPEEIFKKMDANADGALTLEEMQQAHAKRARAMGQGRRGPQRQAAEGGAAEKPAE